jgi:hypothetical protein
MLPPPLSVAPGHRSDASGAGSLPGGGSSGGGTLSTGASPASSGSGGTAATGAAGVAGGVPSPVATPRQHGAGDLLSPGCYVSDVSPGTTAATASAPASARTGRAWDAVSPEGQEAGGVHEDAEVVVQGVDDDRGTALSRHPVATLAVGEGSGLTPSRGVDGGAVGDSAGGAGGWAVVLLGVHGGVVLQGVLV